MTRYQVEWKARTDNGVWRKTLIVKDSMTAAELECFEIERMGYATRVVPVEGK